MIHPTFLMILITVFNGNEKYCWLPYHTWPTLISKLRKIIEKNQHSITRENSLKLQASPAVADKPVRRESMPKIAPIQRPYNVVADNTGLSSFV